jgi:hypothetical protein
MLQITFDEIDFGSIIRKLLTKKYFKIKQN